MCPLPNRAHRASASGPRARPAERTHDSVAALHAAACARRSRIEERTIETREFRTEAVSDRRPRATRVVRSFRRADPLELRAARRHRRRAAEYLRIAARADRVRRDQPRAAAATPREQQLLLADRAAPVDRARDHLRRVRARPPRRAGRPGARPHGPAHRRGTCRSATRTASIGAERVPSGAYLGDRDMFLFLVDGNRDLDDPTDAAARRPVPRVHPPEQRRGRRRLDPGCVPVPRRVRQPHHLGLQHVAGFRRRHVGASIQEAWTVLARWRARALDADTTRRYAP
ncbi:MAG: hypothetical protein MZV70_07670 [Desulfobacterales bacterium]|nr:hypothetical protein [Desulfobacterales bacterium]